METLEYIRENYPKIYEEAKKYTEWISVRDLMKEYPLYATRSTKYHYTSVFCILKSSSYLEEKKDYGFLSERMYSNLLLSPRAKQYYIAVYERLPPIANLLIDFREKGLRSSYWVSRYQHKPFHLRKMG